MTISHICDLYVQTFSLVAYVTKACLYVLISQTGKPKNHRSTVRCELFVCTILRGRGCLFFNKWPKYPDNQPGTNLFGSKNLSAPVPFEIGTAWLCPFLTSLHKP